MNNSFFISPFFLWLPNLLKYQKVDHHCNNSSKCNYAESYYFSFWRSRLLRQTGGSPRAVSSGQNAFPVHGLALQRVPQRRRTRPLRYLRRSLGPASRGSGPGLTKLKFKIIKTNREHFILTLSLKCLLNTGNILSFADSNIKHWKIFFFAWI